MSIKDPRALLDRSRDFVNPPVVEMPPEKRYVYLKVEEADEEDMTTMLKMLLEDYRKQT